MASEEATRAGGSPARRGRSTIGDRAAGDPPRGVDHLADAERPCRCRRCRSAPARLDPLEGAEVGVGQVLDVDVVADAGAVGRRVVGAEDGDVLALAERDLEDERDQVRLGRVVLADRAVVGGAAGVEVAEGGVAQAVGAA